MTHTMYLNQHGNLNRSFIDIATRVVPAYQSGSWTREPAKVEAPKQPFPADDAWRRADKRDLLMTAAIMVPFFSAATLAAIF
jgi:hypothetical protein